MSFLHTHSCPSSRRTRLRRTEWDIALTWPKFRSEFWPVGGGGDAALRPASVFAGYAVDSSASGSMTELENRPWIFPQGGVLWIMLVDWRQRSLHRRWPPAYQVGIKIKMMHQVMVIWVRVENKFPWARNRVWGGPFLIPLPSPPTSPPHSLARYSKPYNSSLPCFPSPLPLSLPLPPPFSPPEFPSHHTTSHPHMPPPRTS